MDVNIGRHITFHSGSSWDVISKSDKDVEDTSLVGRRLEPSATGSHTCSCHHTAPPCFTNDVVFGKV